MSSPAPDPAAPPRPARTGGVPLRRYLLALPAAFGVFLVLTMIEARDVFLPALGLAPEAAPLDLEGAARAEKAVQAFNAALGAAYRQGTLAPLPAGTVSPELASSLEAELAFARRGGHPLPTGLVRAQVLQVEPRPGGGWTLLMDETWTVPGPKEAQGRAARLRLRYTLSEHDGRLRIEQMTPVLPEPPGA